jgi:hypothetical protein
MATSGETIQPLLGKRQTDISSELMLNVIGSRRNDICA